MPVYLNFVWNTLFISNSVDYLLELCSAVSILIKDALKKSTTQID
jgi:hypothetical protein